MGEGASGSVWKVQDLQTGKKQAVKYDKAFIIFEKMGPSLQWFMSQKIKSKLTLKLVCEIGIQLVNQIEQLHSIGYVHRDIKPENILLIKKAEILTSSPQLSIVDFGASRKYLNEIGLHQQNKIEGTFFGNFAFASLYHMLGHAFNIGKIKIITNMEVCITLYRKPSFIISFHQQLSYFTKTKLSVI
ncbi:serine threonine protein kinase [Stylonychia lemnae]|uniref:Casein kinase I n=1 Tax=Stylonychia lemnae TaxID=5949 RepID=A0A077ZQ43_STYLE|nr:serine threonine protein kinase [Stylonychia lemnae]|eukprot:CDW71500.1 serine threonine protein kinase [Stylonychia lemnae]